MPQQPRLAERLYQQYEDERIALLNLLRSIPYSTGLYFLKKNFPDRIDMEVVHEEWPNTLRVGFSGNNTQTIFEIREYNILRAPGTTPGAIIRKQGRDGKETETVLVHEVFSRAARERGCPFAHQDLYFVDPRQCPKGEKSLAELMIGTAATHIPIGGHLRGAFLEAVKEFETAFMIHPNDLTWKERFRRPLSPSPDQFLASECAQTMVPPG